MYVFEEDIVWSRAPADCLVSFDSELGWTVTFTPCHGEVLLVALRPVVHWFTLACWGKQC